MAPMIEFRSTTKVFQGSTGPITAVDDVSLQIEEGSICAVIGYSGAGKSTLVRLINGLEAVTSGSVIVDGDDVAAMSERQLERKRGDIGMIFQQFNLFRSRTVAGNVAYPLKVARWPKHDRDRRVAELLDFVGLLDRAHDYPAQLSGGQQQRVGIARALAAQPKVLLADESTSALDPQTTADVLALLKRVNQQLGITVVAITHELDVVRSIADQVAILENGRLAEQGPVFDVFTSPRSAIGRRFVTAGLHDRPDGDDLARLRASHPGRLIVASMVNGAKLGSVLAGAAAREVAFEIVYGGISTLQQQSFGSLTLALHGPEPAVDEIIADLRAVTPIEELA